MKKFSKSIIVACLALGLTFSVVPANAATGVNITPGEITVINTLYDQVIALKTDNATIDTGIKTIAKDNTTAIKNVVDAATPLPADVAAITSLQAITTALKTTHATDLALMITYEQGIKAAQAAKDEKQQMILGIEYARLKVQVKPIIDQINANEKEIKRRQQQLKQNAVKQQKSTVDAMLKPLNDIIKGHQVDIKDLEKEERDALKEMSTAISEGNVTASITQLTAVLNLKQQLYNAKQLVYGVYQSQGDVLKSMLTGEPVATFSPSSYSRGVAVNATVTATFNENVTAVNLAGITITYDGNTVLAGVTATISGNTITISHPNFALNKTYVVNIPANTVRDSSNTANSATSFTFTTVTA